MTKGAGERRCLRRVQRREPRLAAIASLTSRAAPESIHGILTRGDLSSGAVRRAVLALLVATAALAGSGGPSLAAGHTVASYVLSAEYKGTYHFEDHQAFQGEKYDAVETFKWDELGTLTVRGDTGAV